MMQRDDCTGDSSWIARAAELAAWTERHLANRTDAWGAYRREEDIGKEYVRTDGTKGRLGEQQTIKGKLTRPVLVRHFQAPTRAAIIGLHSADRDNLTKWGALDIDYHGEAQAPPENNQRAALWWYRALINLGFHPLLTESNGRGGYHLRILLAERIDAARLFHFLKNLTADHRQLGFGKAPEQFPKQGDVRRCARQLGNWLRLPGRHHKRPFWSRVWDGERWLDGHEAIDFMLSLRGDPALFVPPVPPPRTAAKSHSRAATSKSDNLSVRIDAYMRKLPHGGEGTGRDNVAFAFACFLVRDMKLTDNVALEWLKRWDSGNSAEKGENRLKEIIASAHAYGTNAYGCGLASDTSSSGVYPDPKRGPGHYILRGRIEVY